MDEHAILNHHIVDLKHDIDGLILQLERIRLGGLEGDILRQINEKHAIIQALLASKTNFNPPSSSSRQYNTAQTNSFDTGYLSSPILTLPPSAASPFARDATTHAKSLAPANPSSLPTPTSPTSSNICPCCGRHCSSGNMPRHKKTCLGRCLNCTRKQAICDDRGRGAPSNSCKGCIENDIACVFVDPSDGKWKAKFEFVSVARTSRMRMRAEVGYEGGAIDLKQENGENEEKVEDNFYGGV